MAEELKRCIVDYCNKHVKNGDKYCSMHRARLSRTGQLELKPKPTIKEILSTNIFIDDNFCWNWLKYKNKLGYGRLHINRKQTLAHRASYLVFKGKIPEGMRVCHSCDNPSCINPDHLWLGTDKDNVQDAIRKGRVDPVKRAKERWIKCPTIRKN